MLSKIKLQSLFIKPEDSIYKALEVIEKAGAGSGSQLALVIDEDKKLLGVVNDGDIRRAILTHNSLDIQVQKIMTTNYTSVTEKTSRASVLDKMNVLKIDQIPIIDPGGKVTGLHLLHEILSLSPLNNAAVIMAGGKGERLKPITDTTPKPMIRVAGRPILEHIVLHLAGSGIKEIYIAVNYMSHVIEEHFSNGKKFGCSIKYFRETKPLGTAGALSLLPPVNNDIILMNGDLITQFNVRKILEKHTNNNNKLTIGARNFKVKIPYGVLEIEDKKVVNIVEKPKLQYFVNGGIYIISPEIIRSIPSDEQYFITDLINECFNKQKKVGFHNLENDWIDIGEYSQLSKALGNDS